MKETEQGQKNSLVAQSTATKRASSFFRFSTFPCLARLVLIGAARLYQYTLGAVLPNACRFTPTCSEYSIQAVRKFGAFKGGWLTLKRILRCNQFFKGGCDPVP